MNPIRECATRAVAVTLGVGLAVAAGAAVAHADDAESASANPSIPPIDSGTRQLNPTEDRTATRRQVHSQTTCCGAPHATSRPLLGGQRRHRRGGQPFDGLTAAFAAINREINRLFFNHTPTAHPWCSTR